MVRNRPIILLSLTIFLTILLNISLSAKTIRVPHDFSTIKQAVNMAIDGDTVEVDDGFYFEKNLVIDKKIHLKSKNLFGAVIDGGKDPSSSIIIIRSQAEIEGFILKNSGCGILQRESPDVTWMGHDLAILDMGLAAININDKYTNIGSASIFNIIVDNANYAFTANDANRLKIENCLVTNTSVVFNGSNFIEFSANRISILNCKAIIATIIPYVEPVPPATHLIDLGPDIHILDDLIINKSNSQVQSVITNILSEKINNKSDGINHHNMESISLDILGEVYFRLGDYDKAVDQFLNAATFAERMGSLEILWDSYYGLARISESRERFSEAIAYYEKSIRTIENFRNRLPLMEYKSAYMQSKMKVYESFIQLLFKLHKSNPLENYHEKAFYFVESFKARTLLDKFQESDIDLESYLHSETKKELNTILTETARIQKALKQSDLPTQKRSILLNKLEEKEDDFTSLMIRIKSRNKEFANLVSPRTCTYTEVRDGLLNDGTALIEYYMGKNNSYIFVGTKDRLYMEQLQDPLLLKNMVRKYLYFLTLDNNKEFMGINGGEKLYSLLIRPALEMQEQNIHRLIIIPDDCLLGLPFETLIHRKSKFLIEDFDISYAPSSSALMNLKDLKIRAERTSDLLALASDHSSFGLPPIHKTIYEVNAISKFFDKNKRTLLTKKNATEKNLKGKKLENFKIIHFATHAFIDDKKWYRSALILEPEETSDDDGLLQPKDLITLKFSADLIVLSSCQTRQGKLEAGEGIFGLTRVFLYTGTKSVLSSLWRIDDRISPVFMKYFYQYLAQGKSADSALRLAKIDMLNSKYCHPRYWASFVLIGNSGPILESASFE